jgi:hypothetical protein
MTGSLYRLDRMLAITGLHVSHPIKSLLTPTASIIALEVVSFFQSVGYVSIFHDTSVRVSSLDDCEQVGSRHSKVMA